MLLIVTETTEGYFEVLNGRYDRIALRKVPIMNSLLNALHIGLKTDKVVNKDVNQLA